MKNKNIKANQEIYYYDNGLDVFGDKKISSIIVTDDNKNMVKRINYEPCGKVTQHIFKFDNNENLVKEIKYFKGKLEFIKEIKCNENGSIDVTTFNPDGTIRNKKIIVIG